jgi:effector-binding domain-containing protein
VIDVALRTIEPRPIAVARRAIDRSEIATAMVPALDSVWAFVRAQGLDTGHNVAVYVDAPGDGTTAWFGVEITEPFSASCSIQSSTMPHGLTAVATHVGPYDQLGATHQAVRDWCAAEQRALSWTSWEVYGDRTDYLDQLETTVGYLLA